MPTKHHRARLDPKLAYFKLHIRRSRIERYGVFANEAIPRGKRVIQYTGERISHREATQRALRVLWALKPEALRRAVTKLLAGKAERVYSIRLNRRWALDGSNGGSGAEFMNHSCDPNLTVRRIRGQIFLYSFRKIRAGEELTVDYGFRCALQCRCGSANCRGTMCQV